MWWSQKSDGHRRSGGHREVVGTEEVVVTEEVEATEEVVVTEEGEASSTVATYAVAEPVITDSATEAAE